MDIREYKKSNRLSEWAKMIGACRNSGQTVAAWCEENGISRKSYYYRQRRVCDAMPDLHSAAILPVSRSDSPVNFAEVSPAIRAKAGEPAVIVHIGNTEVQIRDCADAATIEVVLRILAGIC